MDKKNSEKTAAELYREERKKRLEKAAKKNAKSSPELSIFTRNLGKFVAIVLVAAILLGCVYGILSFFGVPQKVITVSTIEGGSLKTEKVSAAKFNYYFIYTYDQLVNTAYQYEQNYGTGMGKMYTGFDYSLAPDVQEYTVTQLEGFEDGEKAYWSDYIRITALESLRDVEAVYMEAVNAGYKLTDEQQENIDKEIEDLRTKAKENEFSLNRYIIWQYGKGVDENLLREIFEEQTVCQNYLADKYDEIEAGESDDKIEKEFKENKADYALVTVRLFSVPADAEVDDDMSEEEQEAKKEAALEAAKAKADAAVKDITDEESFLAAAEANVGKDETFKPESTLYEGATYDSLQSYYGTNTADWAYDNARKVGDVSVIEGASQYVIAYMVKLPYKNDIYSSNVRHILFQFETDSNGNDTMTDDDKAALKEKAEKILKEFKANPSEEAFIDLVNEYSEDPGKDTNEGLYEDIRSDSQYVDSFKNWAIDANRKEGDVELIESEYGYHIMYFVGYSDKPIWYMDIKESLANSDYNTYYDDLVAKHPATNKDSAIKWSVNSICKHINNNQVNHYS
jgi:parvulin-like peptidyl-prolyl isomerase